MIRRWPVLTLGILLSFGACGGGPLEAWQRDYHLPDADLRVVFVGNSLTYTHNVPALVEGLARTDGRSFAQVSVTAPNVSLEDHWYLGTPDVLRELEPDVVVLQQGPSSLPLNQVHLRRWAGEFAGVIRELGGEPALYMVWPSDARRSAFEDVWTAYRVAADSVDGLFIPAGQTWVEAWAIDPGMELYGPDGFHPSWLGALAAAQTIYARLYGVDAESVPAPDGVDAETRATLRTALAASLMRADSAGL